MASTVSVRGLGTYPQKIFWTLPLEKELLDLPFVEEYMSLLEVFKDYLKILEKDISAFITSDLTFI